MCCVWYGALRRRKHARSVCAQVPYLCLQRLSFQYERFWVGLGHNHSCAGEEARACGWVQLHLGVRVAVYRFALSGLSGPHLRASVQVCSRLPGPCSGLDGLQPMLNKLRLWWGSESRGHCSDAAQRGSVR